MQFEPASKETMLLDRLFDWIPALSKRHARAVIWFARKEYVGTRGLLAKDRCLFAEALSVSERSAYAILQEMRQMRLLLVSEEEGETYYSLNPDWSPPR